MLVFSGASQQSAALGLDQTLSRRTDACPTYLYDHVHGRMRDHSYAIGIRHAF